MSFSTWLMCSSSPPGKMYFSMNSPMPAPSWLGWMPPDVMPWFITSPPGLSSR